MALGVGPASLVDGGSGYLSSGLLLHSFDRSASGFCPFPSTAVSLLGSGFLMRLTATQDLSPCLPPFGEAFGWRKGDKSLAVNPMEKHVEPERQRPLTSSTHPLSLVDTLASGPRIVVVASLRSASLRPSTTMRGRCRPKGEWMGVEDESQRPIETKDDSATTRPERSRAEARGLGCG